MKKNLFLILASLLLVPGILYAETVASKKKNVIYETPTYKTISQLYWALSKFDPEVDEHIDNFLLINECDLYKDYSQNEFEWNGIKEGTREFLKANKKNFPTHFEFVQPLRFAEYDLETQEFDVWEPYKVDGIRRFEVLSQDMYDDVCEQGWNRHMEGYPKGLFVELNRPFTADKVSIPPDIAEAYIQKQHEDNRKANVFARTKKDLYKSRDAYLVMKLRIFSYKEEIRTREHVLAKVLAVLEGYEIYGDRERLMLLFSEDFKRKKQRSKMEIEMKRRYQERLKKQLEEEKKAAETEEVSAQ